MLLLAALLIAATAAVQLPGKLYYDLNHADSLFQQFLRGYGKVYNPEEYLTRLDTFKENLKEINERNARHPQTEFGVTRFTDLTAEERRGYLGFERSDDEIAGRVTKLEYPAEALTAPDQFDWRELRAVTQVKDQNVNKCGSCFIFSAIGVIEGQHAIKYNKLVSLSEQHALDCMSPEVWDSNCSGGWLDKVLTYFEYHRHRAVFESDYPQEFGIFQEKDYPYTAKTGDCKEKSLLMNGIKPVTNVTTTRMYNMDEESLKQLLYLSGPLGIGTSTLVGGAITNSRFDHLPLGVGNYLSARVYIHERLGMRFRDFLDYKSGIAHPIKCIPQSFLDHDVLLVGYGIENGTKYWIIKNSFGPKWGEDGYIRLVRGERACGIGRYVATCTIP